jgi:hypothetical protein
MHDLYVGTTPTTPFISIAIVISNLYMHDFRFFTKIFSRKYAGDFYTDHGIATTITSVFSTQEKKENLLHALAHAGGSKIQYCRPKDPIRLTFGGERL